MKLYLVKYEVEENSETAIKDKMILIRGGIPAIKKCLEETDYLVNIISVKEQN